jgi:hypothetical protein
VNPLAQLAMARAKPLSGADHADVQPCSGSPANPAVFFALLRPGDTVMGMAVLCFGDRLSGRRRIARVQFTCRAAGERRPRPMSSIVRLRATTGVGPDGRRPHLLSLMNAFVLLLSVRTQQCVASGAPGAETTYALTCGRPRRRIARSPTRSCRTAPTIPSPVPSMRVRSG